MLPASQVCRLSAFAQTIPPPFAFSSPKLSESPARNASPSDAGAAHRVSRIPNPASQSRIAILASRTSFDFLTSASRTCRYDFPRESEFNARQFFTSALPILNPLSSILASLVYVDRTPRRDGDYRSSPCGGDSGSQLVVQIQRPQGRNQQFARRNRTSARTSD